MSRLLAVVAALAAVLALASPAAGHSNTVQTEPVDGATLAVLPDQVTITLDEKPMEVGNGLVVRGPDDVVVSGTEPTITGHSLSVPIVAQGPAGAYRVGYRVVSSDGHVVTGKLTFTVTSGRPVTGAIKQVHTNDDENSVTAVFAVFSVVMMAAFVVVAALIVRRRR